MHIMRIMKRGTFVCLLFLMGLAIVPIQAQASNAPRTETLKAGPYSIEVTLSPDPPEVEKPLNVTLVVPGRSLLISMARPVMAQLALTSPSLHPMLFLPGSVGLLVSRLLSVAHG